MVLYVIELVEIGEIVFSKILFNKDVLYKHISEIKAQADLKPYYFKYSNILNKENSEDKKNECIAHLAFWDDEELHSLASKIITTFSLPVARFENIFNELKDRRLFSQKCSNESLWLVFMRIGKKETDLYAEPTLFALFNADNETISSATYNMHDLIKMIV